MQTSFVFNCEECGEVWDVLDVGQNKYLCRECGSEVKQVIENGKEKIHVLTEEEEDNISLREDDCSEWGDYNFP